MLFSVWGVHATGGGINKYGLRSAAQVDLMEHSTEQQQAQRRQQLITEIEEQRKREPWLFQEPSPEVLAQLEPRPQQPAEAGAIEIVDAPATVGPANPAPVQQIAEAPPAPPQRPTIALQPGFNPAPPQGDPNHVQLPPGTRILTTKLISFKGGGDATAAARKALKKVDWVLGSQVQVDVVNKRITIPFSGGNINGDQVEAALQEAGFKVFGQSVTTIGL
jgi:hypothetical protein